MPQVFFHMLLLICCMAAAAALDGCRTVPKPDDKFAATLPEEVPIADLGNGAHQLTVKIVNQNSSGYYTGRSVQFDGK